MIVVAESGCCAEKELNAVATARASPSAGPILPRAMVRPAVTIEAMAMSVMLSIVSPGCRRSCMLEWSGGAQAWALRPRVAAAIYTAARMLKM